jgi:hypothetical protein
MNETLPQNQAFEIPENPTLEAMKELFDAIKVAI